MAQLTIEHKKGVRIVSRTYPAFRSWRTSKLDKNNSPTPIELIHEEAQADAGPRYSTDVVATAHIIFNLDYKPPSLNAEDKMSITPNNKMSAKNRIHVSCLLQHPESTAKLDFFFEIIKILVLFSTTYFYTVSKDLCRVKCWWM